MADGDPGKDQPSLELPKLGWRRKRRPSAPEPAALPPETPPPPAPELEEVGPAYVDEAEPATAPEPVPAAVTTGEAWESEPEPARAARVRRPGGLPAVVLTGVVVGLGIVGLTWAGLRGCESVQGTPSCGNAGYGLLLAILAVMVVVGAVLLRLARVPEPGSTSFLGVGLTSVLALLFLVDSLLDRSMVVVIPLITACGFAAAHWLTRTFAEPGDR